jgi:hypothetical protein
MPKQLSESEAEKMILTFLAQAEKPVTTRQIEETAQGEGKQCPDSTVRFLSKMRYKGLIKGELSREHKGWIWWLEEITE